MGSRAKQKLVGTVARAWGTNPYIRALYSFNALSLVGGIVYGLYYGIFLYKNTFSLSVLAIDGLLGGLGCWLGYVLAIYLVRRVGYGRSLKIAFALWALVSFLTALIAGHIAQWFMLLAVLKAMPGGMFAATTDTIMLREIKHTARHDFLQVKLALEFLATVILPTVVGALLHFSAGYQLAFLLAGLIYLSAVFIPVALPKPQLHFNFREVLGTFKRPLYPRHAANRTLAAGFNQLNGFAIMIIPFLLLQDELKLGLLTSAIALLASIVSIMVRKIKTEKKMKLGYASYTVRAVMGGLFIMSWTAPVLMVWQLINKLATPLHDPLQQGLDIHNDSLIMGKDVETKALHINILNNTLLLIGTTVAYGVFYFITRLQPHNQQHVLQILILCFAGWRFINLAVSASINAKAKLLLAQSAHPELARVPLLLLLRSSFRSRLRDYRFVLVRV
jgi:MFS family permease